MKENKCNLGKKRRLHPIWQVSGSGIIRRSPRRKQKSTGKNPGPWLDSQLKTYGLNIFPGNHPCDYPTHSSWKNWRHMSLTGTIIAARSRRIESR